MRCKLSKSLIKKIAFSIVVVLFLLTALMIIVRYQKFGETSMPFELEKILMVSTVDAEKIDDPNNLWNIPIDQVNDIYIYIKKNDTAKKERLIKEIRFDNFQITEEPQNGDVVLLKATGDINTNNLYNNSTDDFFSKGLIFNGGEIDDMKGLEIANIGGVCGFRMALKNLGSFVSTESEEVIYDGSLLSRIGIKQDDIRFKTSFDMSITMDNNICYKGTINLELPAGSIIEKGKSSIEKTDFSDVIFKRV